MGQTGLAALKPDQVRPFAVNLPTPERGESLLGFATRCFSRTPVRQTAQALTLATIGKLSPDSLATTLDDPVIIKSLATLLQSSVSEIESRLHRPGTLDNGRSIAIDFFGIMIRSAYRIQGFRRVSPLALRKSLHHRAMWDLKMFSFDPETWELLIARCPICTKKLTWRRAYGIHMCDRCRDTEGFADVDLRDFPQQLIEVDDMEALEFVVDLVNPDDNIKRDAVQAVSKPMWSALSPSELFETTIAFACALTMKTNDSEAKLLKRPKLIDEYLHLTPEILATAGRVMLDGEKGFAVVADRIRSQSGYRTGFYGASKELLPLVCMSWDVHLSKATRTIIKSAIQTDMYRAGRGHMVRGKKPAHDIDHMEIKALALKTGLNPRALGRLANSGLIQVVAAAGAKKSPKSMALSDVQPLVEIYNASILERSAAACLGVNTSVLSKLEARGLIHRVDGPVVGLFQSSDPYYSVEEIKELAAMIDSRINLEPRTKPMPIISAVKHIDLSPIPWGAVIAAIVSGKAEIHRVSNDGKTWRTCAGTCNLQAFLDAVQAEIIPEDTQIRDRWIGNQVAAEILKTNVAVISGLSSRGILGHNGPKDKPFDRDEVLALAQRYIFIPEIVRRTNVADKDVRRWLSGQGVEIAFGLKDNARLAFAREAVEMVIQREGDIPRQVQRRKRTSHRTMSGSRLPLPHQTER